MALNFQKEKPKCNIVYELPDGQCIDLEDERFQCPEIMFDITKNGKECFSYHGKDCKSVSEVIANYIQLCEMQGDVRCKSFCENIVLSGGTSMFGGFKERVEKDVKSLVGRKNRANIKVHAPENRKLLSWIGGSKWASNKEGGYLDRVISTQEYNENGPSIVHRKCC